MQWSNRQNSSVSSRDITPSDTFNFRLDLKLNKIGVELYIYLFNIEALVVMDVHAKDVVENMTKKEVHKTKDFNWLSQLRYYWTVRINLFNILYYVKKFINK